MKDSGHILISVAAVEKKYTEDDGRKEEAGRERERNFYQKKTFEAVFL